MIDKRQRVLKNLVYNSALGTVGHAPGTSIQHRLITKIVADKSYVEMERIANVTTLDYGYFKMIYKKCSPLVPLGVNSHNNINKIVQNYFFFKFQLFSQ